jgi:hypothetical protein
MLTKVTSKLISGKIIIYLYKRGKSPRAAKTAEIFNYSVRRERERERKRQRLRVAHMQGMGSPSCPISIGGRRYDAPSFKKANTIVRAFTPTPN